MNQPVPTTTVPVNATLKETFGFDSFRENQEGIISAIINGQDVFTIMPTGGGKSLCYQLPAVIMDGVCVVVSPLIALMKDQVDGAVANGIRAAYINSSLTSDEKRAVMKQLENEELDLLYVAPERMKLNSFWDYLKTIRIAFFAIDEAHCISEWGHDFRPDYMVLSNLKQQFPTIPVAAFTASATDVVQKDILSRLQLHNPLVIKASFDRPNLYYQVARKHSVNEQIIDFIRARPGEGGIVYRATRKDVESTAAFLMANGVNALPYHAGMEPDERKANQERFNRDETRVIVATIAFGMGIDKSNIRFVIHGDLPKSLEAYYQETGRAGRDGGDAQCMMLYSAKDEDTQTYFINQIEDPAEKERSTAKLASMVAFAQGDSCRRVALLNYFGETYPEATCGTCDICTSETERVDITKDAQILLSAIARTEERFGINHVIDVIRGANTKKIRSFGHDTLKTYGAGDHMRKEQWLEIFDQLQAMGAVKRLPNDNNRVVLRSKGKDILYGRQNITVNHCVRKHDAPQTVADYDKELFAELRDVRTSIAEERLVPPYVIFSDRTLHDMARYYPVDNASFLALSGVGQRKLNDFGDRFLSCIKGYLADNPDTDVTRYSSAPANSMPRYKKPANPEVYATSLALFHKGYDLQGIADAQGLKPGTVASHLEMAVSNGESINVDHLITTPHRTDAEAAFAEMGTASLGDVYRELDERVPYDQLKFIRLALRVRAPVYRGVAQERRPAPTGASER